MTSHALRTRLQLAHRGLNESLKAMRDASTQTEVEVFARELRCPTCGARPFTPCTEIPNESMCIGARILGSNQYEQVHLARNRAVYAFYKYSSMALSEAVPSRRRLIIEQLWSLIEAN